MTSYWTTILVISAWMRVPPLFGRYPSVWLESSPAGTRIAQIGLACSAPGFLLAWAACEPLRPTGSYSPGEEGWDEFDARSLAESTRFERISRIVLPISGAIVCWPMGFLPRRRNPCGRLHAWIGFYTLAHASGVSAAYVFIALHWNALLD